MIAMITPLKRLGLGIILMVFVLLPLAEVPAREIALQLYSLRNQLNDDLEKYHALINQLDIRNIEGGITYDLPMKAYQKLLQKHNLQLISVGGSYEKMEDDPQAVIDKAKAS